ncbi:A disintegrin and metalloproteinase with thrombospondin motifs 6-like [Tubulanus polymorphus]|uniref:A disintegrin and metalloproteinase with thrombospondin motifs 6-like n=1 Tax=Tubulanus polymorphus TaxID=672921 RepID=UPI003DA4F0A2
MDSTLLQQPAIQFLFMLLVPFILDVNAFPDPRQALFVSNLENHEIIIPQKVSEDGQFLSHKLMQYYHIPKTHRQKRDISGENRVPDSNVHYKISVRNKTLHLTLSPNHRLTSPGMVTERWKRKFGNISDATIVRKRGKSCHFSGEIKGQPNSRVAISTCDGLTGFFHSDNVLYFIEPVKGHRSRDGDHQPHVVYERNSLPEHLGGSRKHEQDTSGHASCEINDTEYEEAEHDRDRWQKENQPANKKTNRRRTKRSVSVERRVEALVVVDPAMMKFHITEDIETYVLTIMNMVAHIYHDASIGNAIDIVLVRLLLLEDEQDDLKVSHHADNTLQSFCKWQHKIQMKDDKHPNHHDVAILLTRVDICSRLNEPCSTLGLAQVSGMCQPHRSCNINEDTGLALAFTIAHELGHNFGMKHDSPVNGCEAPYGERQHVMSPQLIADNSPMAWSSCSRGSMTKFLDRDWGYCLEDEPADHDFKFPIVPPGTMYDADHQCRLQYGAGAKHCDGIEEVCTTLWCKVDNKCMTRLEAAAEGTICGENRWCYEGGCSLMGERPQAIDGEWSEWSEWTPCTRTCGGGVKFAERHCNNPPPSSGGKYCLGERKRFKLCNIEACDEKDVSFRFQQCQEFNTIPYKGSLFSWTPVSSPATPCQLHCKPTSRFFSVMLKDIVIDGTPCRPGNRDMCISGKCKQIGCDWKIQSNAKEDRCGVCHGDGSSCTTVKKKFTEKLGLGYVEATVIPKDARNIRIEEVAEANNYLALRNEDGKYYLNGHWFIQWSGDYEAAGTIVHYKRQRNKESMFASGPLKEPLYLMLLFQSQNPGVTYEYTVPNENTTARTPVFHWKYTAWSHCSVSCGGGTKRKGVLCLESEDGIVEERYCNASLKPDDLLKTCNTHICPAQWWHGPWQHCSVTCGDGGTHRRSVICVRSRGPDEQIALEDHECEGLPKPPEEEPCHHHRNCPKAEWISGKWTDTCHGDPCGTMTRDVYCSDPDSGCDIYTKPMESKQCSNITCGIWKIGHWSTCSSSCGEGLQFRRVLCVQGQKCPLRNKPADHRICEVDCSTTTFKPSKPTTTTTTTTAATVLTTKPMVDHLPKERAATMNRIKPKITENHRNKDYNNDNRIHEDYAPEELEENGSIRNEIKNSLDYGKDIKNMINKGEISKQDQDFFLKITGSTLADVYRKMSVPTTRHSTVSTTRSVSQTTKSPISPHEVIAENEIHDSYFTDQKNDAGIAGNIENHVSGNNINLHEKSVEIHDSDEDLNDDDSLGAIDIPVLTTTSRQPVLKPKISLDKHDPYSSVHFEKKMDNRKKNKKTGNSPASLPSMQTKIAIRDNKNDISSDKESTMVNSEVDGNVRQTVITGSSVASAETSKDFIPPSATISKVQISHSDSNSKSSLKTASTLNTTKKHRDNEIDTAIIGGTENKRSHFKWMPLFWSECSSVCGPGKRRRKVVCIDVLNTNEVSDKHCENVEKLSEIEDCSRKPCLKWRVAAWSQCSTSCGHGVQQRRVKCLKVNFCNPADIPITQRPCILSHCIVWIAGSWSECSRTCGGGVQARHVQCVNQTSYQPVEGCPFRDKPEDERHCNTDACPRQNAALMDWNLTNKCAVDKMSRHVCRVLKRFGQCRKRYVQVKCCRTCRNADKRKHLNIHVVTA